MLRFFENFDLGNCLEKKKIDIFVKISRNFQNFENPR